MMAIGLVPMFVPNAIDLGMVENDDNRKILPFKSAKLISFDGDLNERWYIEFWAWSKSENRLKRKRITTLNKYKTKAEREAFAAHTLKEINALLEKGFHFDNLKLEKLKGIEQIKKIKEHITIIQYLEKSLEINKNKYNGRTYSDKKHDVKIFKEFILSAKLNHLAFDDLQKKHCYQYQQYLLNKDYSGKTINCRMSTIGTFYREAIEMDIINKNPFEGIKRIKEVKTGINKALTNLELESIKHILKDNHKELWCTCMLMFYCYLRPNEIRQLKLKDIDLRNMKIFVGSIVSKNKKSSLIDLPKPVCDLLRDYIGNETNSEMYLFTCEEKPGFRMYGRNHLRDKYNKLIKPLNLDPDLTYYSWKHTGVVKAFKSGIDIKAIQLQGRWHSIDMMDKYLKTLGLIENEAFTSVMNRIEV